MQNLTSVTWRFNQIYSASSSWNVIVYLLEKSRNSLLLKNNNHISCENYSKNCNHHKRGHIRINKSHVILSQKKIIYYYKYDIVYIYIYIKILKLLQLINIKIDIIYEYELYMHSLKILFDMRERRISVMYKLINVMKILTVTQTLHGEMVWRMISFYDIRYQKIWKIALKCINLYYNNYYWK